MERSRSVYHRICENITVGELWSLVQSNPQDKEEILRVTERLQGTEEALTVEGIRELWALGTYEGPILWSLGDRGRDLEYLSFRLRGPFHLLVEEGIGSLSRFLEMATVRALLYPASHFSVRGLGWYRNRDSIGNLIIRDIVLSLPPEVLFFQVPSLTFQLPEALELARKLTSLTRVEFRFLDPEPVCDFVFFQVLSRNPIQELGIHIPVREISPEKEEEERELYTRLLAPPISLLQAQLQRGSSSIQVLRFLPFDPEAVSQEEEDQEYDEPSETFSIFLMGIISDLLSCGRGIPPEIRSIVGLDLPPLPTLRSIFPKLEIPKKTTGMEVLGP